MEQAAYPVSTVTRIRPSARAIISEVAMASGFTYEDILARTDCKSRGRVRRAAYLALIRRRPDLSVRGIARIVQRSPSRVSRGIALAREEEKIVAPHAQHPDYIFELEAQLRRITGVELALQVAHSLSIPTWQAIFLAILMEAYPYVKTADQICEAYDAASERLDRASTDGIQDASMKTFVTRIRVRFEEMGLPDPVARVRPRALVLTDSAAVWLHNQFGKPVAVTRKTA